MNTCKSRDKKPTVSYPFNSVSVSCSVSVFVLKDFALKKEPITEEIKEKDRMRELEQHPLSSAFPGMTKAELESLTDDIAEEGQREPITIFQGKILDGFHRYCACKACGRVPITVELPANTDPVAFVKSRNLHRRHLSASQRAAAVVACTEWAKSGENQHTRGGAPGAGATVREMAREAEVSPRTIQQAKVAVEAGRIEEIRDGKVSVKEAATKKAVSTVRNNSGQADVSPTPESPAKNDPPQPESQIESAEEVINQLRSSLAEVIAGNEAMGKFFDADDALKAAMAENKALRIQVESLEMRINGLMSEKNEAIRAMRKWKAIAEKAGQTAAAQVTIEVEAGSGLPE
jgi:hypothetical protein